MFLLFHPMRSIHTLQLYFYNIERNSTYNETIDLSNLSSFSSLSCPKQKYPIQCHFPFTFHSRGLRSRVIFLKRFAPSRINLEINSNERGSSTSFADGGKRRNETAAWVRKGWKGVARRTVGQPEDRSALLTANEN